MRAQPTPGPTSGVNVGASTGPEGPATGSFRILHPSSSQAEAADESDDPTGRHRAHEGRISEGDDDQPPPTLPPQLARHLARPRWPASPAPKSPVFGTVMRPGARLAATRATRRRRRERLPRSPPGGVSSHPPLPGRRPLPSSRTRRSWPWPARERTEVRPRISTRASSPCRQKIGA